ncbi:DUF4157 domain-containing protein [Hyphobacterium sp. HN65]|uniref:DUF4157 domain-containing protein n=1 Tax=Hyphobacterium lacteum TaxID=3116575 RepID=A0ABU7LRY9_9PROT|nr:DUF4157 domain-containing protein [Hyphobacterium sp. HN65]MEE2526657.1 DUF4157 domain-containing protein [Hyphobacterium sp. HN65]
MKIHKLCVVACVLAVPAPAIAQDNGSGAPVSDEARSGMEISLGSDFSNVAVHTDSSADSAADSAGARAFSNGRDITLGEAGSPDTGLMGHELSHVIQQRSSANPQSSEGSEDAETTGEAEERVPARLRHRNRNIDEEGEPRRRQRVPD